jgi:DNA-binding NarL/FixJ family response regulator
LRVILADDHAVVRKGVRQILAGAFPRATFGEAATATELLDLTRTQAWDILVLDLAMPGINGLDLLKLVKQAAPKLPVLILSMFPEDQFAVRAIRAGAAGYLNKETAPEDLLRAITQIIQGGNFVTAAVADELVRHTRQDDDRRPHELLSDREFQVLRLIGAGRAVKDIAAELGISPATVSTYRARILQKMEMASSAELMRYALKEGLV